MKVLHLDRNHPILLEKLADAGFENISDYDSDKALVTEKYKDIVGLIVRSRFPIDKEFLKTMPQLKFIGRIGAGMENIDVVYAEKIGVKLFSIPEGNQTAVAEHAMGMLLNMLNKLNTVDLEVRNGIWKREENRGVELEGKTVGIIGYGHMGKAFAKRLSGFECSVICYDVLPNKGDVFAQQVSQQVLFEKADIVSLHTPQTPETFHLINKDYIEKFRKPFWFINTARGKSVCTADLVEAIKSGKIIGAALDVLEYEKSSFENMFDHAELPEAFRYLLQSDSVLLSPHIAGWTIESKYKMAEMMAEKIIQWYTHQKQTRN